MFKLLLATSALALKGYALSKTWENAEWFCWRLLSRRKHVHSHILGVKMVLSPFEKNFADTYRGTGAFCFGMRFVCCMHFCLLIIRLVQATTKMVILLVCSSLQPNLGVVPVIVMYSS